jgi:uncharacterized membrane protein
MITTTNNQFEQAEVPVLQVRDVEITASMRWLEKGISDFKKAPMISMSYGMLYVVAGLVLAWLAWENPLFIATMVGGFLIIGPIVAVGFYCMSRQIEEGGTPTVSQGLDALRFNSISLISFTIVLGVLLSIWILLASVTIGLFFNNVSIGGDLWATVLGNEQFVPFIIVYSLVGLLIAAIAFSISAISVPLITNHRVDVMTAIITSTRAVMKNPVAMLSWALIIATLMFLGFIFFFVGLAITLPIIGHASWHAYRDLIVEVTD